MIFIIFLVVVSITQGKKQNFDEVIDLKQINYEGVFEAATICYLGYVPFEVMSTMTKETINPKRDIPKSMIMVPLIVMLTYAGVAFGLTGIGIVQVS